MSLDLISIKVRKLSKGFRDLKKYIFLINFSKRMKNDYTQYLKINKFNKIFLELNFFFFWYS